MKDNKKETQYIVKNMLSFFFLYKIISNKAKK